MKEAFEEIEEDFYSEKILEESIEDDEINAEEEGFMMGYLGQMFYPDEIRLIIQKFLKLDKQPISQ